MFGFIGRISLASIADKYKKSIKGQLFVPSVTCSLGIACEFSSLVYSSGLRRNEDLCPFPQKLTPYLKFGVSIV